MLNTQILRFMGLSLSLSLVCPLTAQETLDEPDPDAKAAAEAQGFRLPPQLRRAGYRDANPWVLHVNARYSDTEANVTFGGLGAIPSVSNVLEADLTDVETRTYDDGGVGLDFVRVGEADANGDQTSTPGGRYETRDDDGVLTGDLLAYTPGQTRQWFYLNADQAGDGTVNLNSFSTESSGASFARAAESSRLGFEMAVSRRLLKFGRNVEVGISGSLGISDFSAKASERITANLITLTDVYNVIGGAVPDAPYNGPRFEELFDQVTGDVISTNGRETTVPLQQIALDRRITTVPNGAEVQGDWQLDGVFYAMRFGPSLRAQLTENIAVSAGAGVLANYIGSDFIVSEVLDVGDYGIFNTIGVSATDTLTDLLIGYYAEVSFEYWITQRTGFFIGAAFESMEDYVQSFGGRTASVILGDSTVVRFGVVHRF